MKNLLKKFWNDEAGLELSEYAIMAALIIIIAIAVIEGLGTKIQGVFQSLSDKMPAQP